MFIAPKFLRCPAPSGAACKRNAPKHMALRWSAKVMVLESYKHSAPLEHFPSRALMRARERMARRDLLPNSLPN